MNSYEGMAKELVETVGRTAANAVGYAVSRNIPLVLRDIEKQIAISGQNADDAATIDVTARFVCRYPGGPQATVRVKSVSWACKSQQIDNDFEAIEIDLMQPEIPGLIAPAVVDHGDNAEVHDRSGEEIRIEARNIDNLQEAACSLGMDIYRPAHETADPNWQRSVDRYSHTKRIWKTAMLPPGGINQCLEIAENKNLVIGRDGYLLNPSVKELVLADYEVLYTDILGDYLMMEIGEDGKLQRRSYELPGSLLDFVRGGGIVNPVHPQMIGRKYK